MGEVIRGDGEVGGEACLQLVKYRAHARLAQHFSLARPMLGSEVAEVGDPRQPRRVWPQPATWRAVAVLRGRVVLVDGGAELVVRQLEEQMAKEWDAGGQEGVVSCGSEE